MVGKYKPVEQIRSRDEQERLYREAVREIEILKRAVNNENIVAKEYKHDRDGLKGELKSAKRSIVTMSKRQKASDEGKKAAAWSGGAAICITILYQLWHTIGFPFARNGADKKWQLFWEHEAVYGAMVWMVTVLFAEVYKATNKS
tara:strand:+ start:386 stop:820 length:435 start_codon:yes stop_codon:yes gene_type:complete